MDPIYPNSGLARFAARHPDAAGAGATPGGTAAGTASPRDVPAATNVPDN